MALKDRIKEAMESAGLSRAALARETKKSHGAVTQWLDGTTKSLKADTASKIGKATGYSADWIVTGRGERKASRKPTESTTTVDEQATTGGHKLSGDATRLAVLFDMLPDDPIVRAQAFNMCTEPLLRLLRPAAEPTLAPELAGSAKTPS